jgi:hypothetical protein
VLFPIRLIAGRWPSPVERRLQRFVWLDPRLVQEPDLDAESFSRLMAAFAVGQTRKITGPGRHTEADALLLEHVDLSDAVIADIGASDGITSVELIRRIPQFRQYVIADLYLAVDAVRVGPRTVFYDRTGQVVLVTGRRLLGWPSVSRPVAWLYRPTLRRAERLRNDGPADATEVLLINPVTRRLLERDPRVSTRTHDIFTRWTQPRPDVVKVANVLRRLYFSDERILAALTVILDDLRDGGHLLLIDNPRATPQVKVRGCLYRKRGDRFALVAGTEHPTEAHDLVLRARARTNQEARP